jgi:hypothetical protein
MYNIVNTLKFNQIEFNHIGEQPTSSVKLQEKSITITENGTTEVVPDNGYALEKVKVKVEGLHRIKYYKFTPELIEYYNNVDTDSQGNIVSIMTTLKYPDSAIKNIMPTIQNPFLMGGADAFSFDLDTPIYFYQYKLTSGEYFLNIDLVSLDESVAPSMKISELLATLPEITEEEYFNFQ